MEASAQQQEHPVAVDKGLHSGVMEAGQIQRLIDVLRQEGYQVLGPLVRDGAIVYDDVQAAEQLPAGWMDEQQGGVYHLKRRGDDALFGFAVGPHSWKRYLFPPVRRLWQAERSGKGSFRIIPDEEPPLRRAFLGVRACELAAIAVQDRVFMQGPYVDPVYAARRRNTVIVAVNCMHAAATCFCTSMDTGPQVRQGYDLALTEILDAERHVFLVEAGTEIGAALLAHLDARSATDDDVAEARRVVERTAASMQRTLDTTDIRDLLLGNLDHPRWDQVADRCLACTNCTMVCPTCFCSTVDDITDLSGQTAERVQTWDSCFTMQYSYIHGGSVRLSGKARYRQWLTHKLASWIDQFGTSGCVGCGRCITWCPVGIDLTEEVRAIRTTAPPAPAQADENEH